MKITAIASAWAVLFLFAACGVGVEHETHHHIDPETTNTPAPATHAASSPTNAARAAIATLDPTEGNTARGTVTFSAAADGVRVVAVLTGLEPGLHGFHIHEKGDCSAPDASSAGGHFNPGGAPHAGPDADKRHAGDLGNIEAGPDGTAQYERVDRHLSLEGPQSILGRAVVVHAKPDDFSSQPAGDAGPRIACGTITPAVAPE